MLFDESPSIIGLVTETRTYETLTEIRALVDETCAALGMPNAVTTIQWNGRFSNRMGDANWVLRRVRFSSVLWPRATVEDRRQTIIHEVCHIVANVTAGKTVRHGLAWKATMRRAGVRPDRCHSVDRTGIRRRNAGSISVVCACPGKIMTLGKLRAGRMRLGFAKYTCRNTTAPAPA